MQVAAAKIQSAFKGMQDRKRVEALKQAKKEDKAALLLQSQFKGIYDVLPQIIHLDRSFFKSSTYDWNQMKRHWYERSTM